MVCKFLNNKEVKNASWLIGGKIVNMLISLIVGIMTARYLGPSNYGLVNYGTAWVTFFTALSNLGINSVIVKEFIDHPTDQGIAIGSTLLLRFVSSGLSVAVIIGLVSIVDSNEPMTISVVGLCSIGLVFQIFEILNYWFQAQYKSKISAIASLIAYAVTSIYKIVLLIFEKDVRWFAFASAVDYIIIAIVLLVAYRKYGGDRFKFSYQKARCLLKNSYHYILSSMMVAIYTQTDKVMLKHMLNENEVSYYSVSTHICGMWVFILAAIIDSMYPTIIKLHSINKEEFDKKNRQLYAIVFYLSCFVSIMFMLFGNWGIKTFYGESYTPAVLPLKIVTWYTAFSYLGVARNAWIVSEGKQKYLKYMYCSAASINIVLNYILIPLLGASGAAMASLITQLFTSIILPLCFKGMRSNAKLMVEAILFRKIL